MRRSFVPLALFVALTSLWASCTLTADSFEPEGFVGHVEADAGGGIASPRPPPSPLLPDAGASPGCVASSEGSGCVQLLLPAGTACESDLQCETRVCVEGACAPASCSDGRSNGDESGVDCGARCPNRCLPAAPCGVDSDCASRSCEAGRCQAASCEDGVRNPEEADQDCGGVCSRGCGLGSTCATTSDCGSGSYCPEPTRVCTSVSCQDGVLNGDEILLDCGGGGCPGCPVGSACREGTDCSTSVCGGDGRCAAASCTDGTLNQNETALDCGGRCPNGCAVGQPCAGAPDCQAGVCGAAGCDVGEERCCQAPSCSDGVRNGTEPQVDCGNPDCGLCPLNRACNADAQCQSAFCQAGSCRVLPCADGTQNGSESDQDCGGTDARCRRCALGEDCNSVADCNGGAACVNGVCAACADGEKNGNETDIDCGGACGACAPGLLCNADADCQRGVCEDGRCCGGVLVDCTRCARRMAQNLSCSNTTDATARSNCDRFLDCLADHPTECPVRHAEFCSADPGGVCNHLSFGGNGGPGLVLADSILGSASCFF